MLNKENNQQNKENKENKENNSFKRFCLIKICDQVENPFIVSLIFCFLSQKIYFIFYINYIEFLSLNQLIIGSTSAETPLFHLSLFLESVKFCHIYFFLALTKTQGKMEFTIWRCECISKNKENGFAIMHEKHCIKNFTEFHML